ncbi:MAG: DUF533 domain-containing protein [Mesorhizobium sp.]|nr:MAG: DUF533 domain-containing protein [Mesorhizobium sp.]
MFDPKKLLDDLLGSQIPGTSGTVRDKAGQAVQMAKDNPLAAGALAAVLLGTGAGREVTGAAVKLGGLAAIGGLAYKAYQNYKAGNAPAEAPAAGEPELLPPPKDTAFHPSQAPQGEDEFTLTLIRAMISAAKADGHIDDDERLTIDPDTRAERGYLDLLAGRLGLPDALVDHVEATVSAAKVPAKAGTSPNPRW